MHQHVMSRSEILISQTTIHSQLWCKMQVCVSCFLSLITGNDTHSPHIRVLGRFLVNPFNFFLRVPWLICPVKAAATLLTVKGRHITIFGNVCSSCHAWLPYLTPNFDAIKPKGLGHFQTKLATRIAVDYIARFPLIDWSHPMSGTYKLFNSALHHLSLQNSTSVKFFYSSIYELQ